MDFKIASLDRLCAHGFCLPLHLKFKSLNRVLQFHKALISLASQKVHSSSLWQTMWTIISETLMAETHFMEWELLQLLNHCQETNPQSVCTAEDIAAVGHINIHILKNQCTGLGSLTFNELVDSRVDDTTSKVDELLKMSFLLHSPWPSQSGIMQMIYQGDLPCPSSVIFLPMIDMNQSDLSCVYSTLLFIFQQARTYTVSPVLRLNQPV